MNIRFPRIQIPNLQSSVFITAVKKHENTHHGGTGQF